MRSILFWGIWIVLLFVFIFLASEGILSEHFGPDFEVCPIILLALLPFLAFIPLIFESFSALFGFSKSSLLFGRGRDAERILEIGRQAEATVVSLTETDQGTVTINGQPYLKLTLEVDDGRSTYTVTHNTIIPRSAIPAFQPGSVFSVRVDQEDPEKIVLVSGGTSQEGWITFGAGDNDSPRLGKDSTAATAKLLSISDTGRSSKFRPVVKLSWEIAPHGKRPYKVSLQKALPTAVVRLLQSRQSSNPIFNARIDKTNKRYFEVCIS